MAIRLQTIEFIIAISPLLGKVQQNEIYSEVVQKFVEYIVKGIKVENLSLNPSAFAFCQLCMDCNKQLCPYAQ